MEPRTEREFKKTTRRQLLKMSPLLLLGAVAVPRLREAALAQGLGFSDWASSHWFRMGHAAQTYSDAQLTPLDKFPLNSFGDDDPEVDLDEWKLEVTGLVAKPGKYDLNDLRKLPRAEQNTRHVCVEGWDVIGKFGGIRLPDFLRMVGADESAKYLYFECEDDYYVSIDMAAALHPQSLLCDSMYGQPLTREHGAPLRLSLPTKIGFKSAKYLTSLKVTNVLQKLGYWEDQGYDWYYGL